MEAGFKYGARLPGTVYGPLYFADQDWKNPSRETYMNYLRKFRPVMATVLDWEEDEQLSEVLDWAEEAAELVTGGVIIIPKVMGGTSVLPRTIDGRRVILGYSVPTKYGGTDVPLWEFAGWPVHLLGGSPQKQIHYYLHLRGIAEVVSVDNNMHEKMAVRLCAFWTWRKLSQSQHRYWPQLQEVGIENTKDAPYIAFKMSCENIRKAWEEVGGS